MGIQIKSYRTILKDMVSWIVGLTSAITDFSEGGVVRSILTAVAVELSRLGTQVYLVYRSSFIGTASGTDLDSRVEQLGIERFPDRYAVGVLTFTGTAGSTVPSGFRVATESGLSFETTQAATIPLGATTVSNVAAVAEAAGAGSNVVASKITVLLQTASGITGVTNPYPFSGGGVAETDAALRERALKRLDVLARGVADSYEQWAIDSLAEVCAHYTGTTCEVGNANWGTNCLDGAYTDCDEFARLYRVYRGKPEPRWDGRGTVKVHCVANDGTGLETWELNRIMEYIDERTTVTADVTVVNATLQQIDLKLTVTPYEGYSQSAIIENIQTTLTNFMDWRTWDWGEDVLVSDLVAQIEATEGVYDVTIHAPTANVSVGEYELPKLGSIQQIILREPVVR